MHVLFFQNAAQADYLITTIKATDQDKGDNGRVSYYLKVDNQNVEETAEFSLDKDTGELRTKTLLDREHKSEYQVRIFNSTATIPSNCLLKVTRSGEAAKLSLVQPEQNKEWLS